METGRTMLQNYIRIAFRTLTKNKAYSLINIFGFAIGITCTLLILLWVNDEMTFDTWIPKHDRIFRLMTRATYDGSAHLWNANPIPAVEAIKESSTEVVDVAISDWGNDHLLAIGDRADRSGIKKRGNYVNEVFLNVFGNKMIHGDPTKALQDMKSIVLTESTAKMLFGDQNPMDKTVRLDDAEELRVTGIVEDVPLNSSIRFDFLVNFKLYETLPWVKKAKDRWDFYSFPIYLELSDKSESPTVISKIFDLPAKHGETDFKKEFWLHPFSRWHLYSKFEGGEEVGGMIEYVGTFAVIAGLVLFIACVNFMNLATARAEKRAVEVGVRKSVGSRRSDLMSQFIWESIVTTAITFVIGIMLAQLLLPFYNQLVSKQLSIPYSSWKFIVACMAMILGVGVLAGSYPAFYLSAFKPVSVLKGGKGTARGGSLPRKVLVTIQFGFSMVLMLATIVVYQQIQHVRDRDMGYNPDNMLIVSMSNDIQKHFKVIKSELLQTGVVEAVTKSNSPITNLDSWSPVNWPGKPDSEKFFFSICATEYDYLKTMGLKLLYGRDFSEDFKSDSSGVIINRAAMELMGLKDPIDAKVGIGQSNDDLHIIGVVENSVSGEPSDIPGPNIITFAPDWAGALTIRMTAGGSINESLKRIETVFKKYSPAYPFEFKFADDEFQRKFTTINLTSRLASIFALLTIIITGLGLFGLAAFTATQRTREMGIRKVMGASVQQLVQLVTTDFSRLVLIAFVLTSPLAWWMTSSYLEQYAYRIDVPWWIFPATGASALIFAMIIVSSQALRAARTNPAQSLRSE